MNTIDAIEKTVIFRTRDFWAESTLADGTCFEVTRRSDGTDGLARWWGEHRFDSHRHVFAPHDACDVHLACHDEGEALEVIRQLQREYSEIAL